MQTKSPQITEFFSISVIFSSPFATNMQDYLPHIKIFTKKVGVNNYMVADNSHNAAVTFLPEPFMSERNEWIGKIYLKTLMYLIQL